MGQLPPEIIPPMIDPVYGEPGPYSVSPLRDVCGHKINPDAKGWYKRRSLLNLPICSAKTCAHPELENWLGDVGSFDPRCTVKQDPTSEWPLSTIMPRVVVWGNELAFPLKPGTFIIDYRYLHTNPHELPSRPWVNHIKDRFPEGSDLILSFYNGRALKLGLWTLQDFWYHPFLDNFKAVIVPAFSDYSDDPKPQYMLSERMMQIFASEGYEAGKTVIPTISWPTDESIKRQFEFWKSQYPHINTIHIDCFGSGVNRRKWIERWLWGLKKYASDAPHIRWLISGIQPAGAIHLLNEIFPQKNYHLIPSVSMFIGATTRAGTDKDLYAKRFYTKYHRFEDLWAGRDADKTWEIPEECPRFSDILLPQENK